MRAAVIDGFGPPEVIRIADVPRPLMGPDEVFIRVRAAGVNPVDFKTVAGRQAQRYPHYFPLIPGWDVSGTVDAVGNAVTEFEPGDQVVAFARKPCLQWGTYAEYVSVAEEAVARAPKSVDLTTAAALPLASLTAHQAIQAAGASAGQSVLVHGGAGGVGSYAVQMLVQMGADVIATSGAGSLDFIGSLGATGVDRHGDVAVAVGDRFPDGVDVALDLAGGPDAVELSLPLMRQGGCLVSILTVPEVADSAPGLRGRYVFVRPYGHQLAALVDEVDAGRLQIHVHRRFRLDEAARALETLQAGGIRGKLVLEVEGAV